MSAMTRPMWAAVLAKLVSPMEPVRAAKAIADMMPSLSLPDEAFTMLSAQEVCASGRVLAAGEYAPLTRVPTFGELQGALGRWWLAQRGRASVNALPVARERLPAPASDSPAERSPEAQAHVSAVVQAFVGERSFNDPAHPQAKPAAKARPASDGALLQEYERLAREGGPFAGAAEIRAEALRKRVRDAVGPVDSLPEVWREMEYEGEGIR